MATMKPAPEQGFKRKKTLNTFLQLMDVTHPGQKCPDIWPIKCLKRMDSIRQAAAPWRPFG